MNGSLKMNYFLQRMLKKSDEELECERVVLDSTSLQVEYSPRGSKSNWIKKLGAYSPSKRASSPSVRSPPRPITSKPAGHGNDYRRRSVPVPTKPNDFAPVSEMPKLEDIIREFEMGFSSPTKVETKETTKSGKFVKKIVAAFEEKYKANNDFKIPAAVSPSKRDDEDDTLNGSETVQDEPERSTAFLSTTYVIDSAESRFSHHLDYTDPKSVRYSRESPYIDDLSSCSFAMDEELFVSTPAKNSSVSSQLPERSAILDEVLEETVKIVESKNLVRSNSSMRRERQPKIVGAFLKEPIEVEDTSIDWIPITNKKLPRKTSFKRLLSMLTGKNKSSSKSSKLYCSHTDLQEETPKDLHDSGYDEKSCSSSSLTSLVSISDLLLRQDNYENGADRRVAATLTTFKQSSSSFERDIPNQDEASIGDDFSDTCSVGSKKIFLEELPRSECRLSLGPAYPPKYVTNSLDRRDPTLTKKSRYTEDSFDDTMTPLASPLPKHPFVSARNSSMDDETPHRDLRKDTNFDEFGKVELRMDCQSWRFPSSETVYDTPRRYLSKSEPGLNRRSALKNSDEVVYDVPKPKIPQRPKSSVYEDALSLKRRNAYFSWGPPASGFYAFPSQEEPHYATVKPRNTRINPSIELLRSVADMSYREFENYNYHTRSIDEMRYL